MLYCLVNVKEILILLDPPSRSNNDDDDDMRGQMLRNPTHEHTHKQITVPQLLVEFSIFSLDTAHWLYLPIQA